MHRFCVVNLLDCILACHDHENHVKAQAPNLMKNKGFGHLATRLFTIKASTNVVFWGPWYILILISMTYTCQHTYLGSTQHPAQSPQG